MAEYASQSVGEEYRYGVDWAENDWLGTATIEDSAWAPDPDTDPVAGIVLEDPQVAGSEASVVVRITAAGTYRVVNYVKASDGARGEHVIVIASEGTAAGAYLSVADAEARLWGRYGIGADLAAGDLEAASHELDAMGPWAGTKADPDQLLAFPREGGPVPDGVLDAAALIAHSLSSDEEPPIKSKTWFGHLAVTYSDPKESVNMRRVRMLLVPYRSMSDSRVPFTLANVSEEPLW